MRSLELNGGGGQRGLRLPPISLVRAYVTARAQTRVKPPCAGLIKLLNKYKR